MFEKVKRFFSKQKQPEKQNEEQTIFFQDMEGKSLAIRVLPNANSTLLHLISTDKDIHIILDNELCKIVGSILLGYANNDIKYIEHFINILKQGGTNEKSI
jgi:hypothetical protein